MHETNQEATRDSSLHYISILAMAASPGVGGLTALTYLAILEEGI